MFGLSVLTSLFASHASAAEEPMLVTSLEGISEFRLENGLKVLLFPDSSKPTVTVNLTVFVGSRHEGYGEAGMAHLLEHMLFKGTPDHPTIPKSLQARGAEFNGTTWVDRTNYYETMPASDENLEFAIRLEADRMINSLIKREDLEFEMTVVRSEFERGENSPRSILGQRMMSAAYEWHNYGKATIGNRADIERVPVENLRAFYEKYYQPDNAMLVVAGRFDEERALELIGKYFGALPKPDRVLPNTYTEEPAQDGERTVTLRRVGEVAVVGVIYHIPSGAHVDYPAIDVLESILTMQPAGRLYKSLVESKKAASVSGAAFAWHDPGVLRIMAEVAAGNTPETVLDTLLDTLDGVVDGGVTDAEVQRAKQRLLKQRELSASDSAEIAVELSEWAAQGDWRLYFLYRDRLEQVTAEDVDRVARAYLQPTNRTVGLYIPTDQPSRTVIPGTPDLAEMIGDYQGRSSATVGEAFDVAPDKIEERTKRMKIGGLDVALLPKKTRGSTVNLRFTVRFGNAETLNNKAMACEFVPAMMTRGTKSLTRQQLQDELDKNLATLSSSGQAGVATFSIQTKRENLAHVLELLKQVLREPVFPATEFDVLKQQQRTSLEQMLADPQSLAVRAVQKKLSPYPAGDPRHVPAIQQELTQLGDLTLGTVKQVYDQFFGADQGQVAVVGDFDPEEIVPILESMIVGWSSRQPYAPITRDGNLDVAGDVVRILTPDKANAVYFAGQVLPMNDVDADYPAMVIGNYIFGAGALSSRLGDRIRQKEGLSYGVGSFFRAGVIDNRASLSIYAICNPDNITKVKDGIREELTLILEKGVTEQELTAAVDGYLQRQEVSRTEDPALAQMLEESLYVGRTMKYYTELEARIRKLTPEDVRRVLDEHLSVERLFIALAGDFKSEKADEKPATGTPSPKQQ
ncbi:MAG: insulinase family protein [Planctomycetaceae bacterium]|nr:insulinase family protein [Planctomycetaceae bacterium]